MKKRHNAKFDFCVVPTCIDRTDLKFRLDNLLISTQHTMHRVIKL